MFTVPYAYYSGTFHGRLAESEYDRLSIYARAYLEDLTSGRVNAAADQEKVKLAFCAAVDAVAMNEQIGNVASESNDGISVTYRQDKSDKARVYDAVRAFLADTGLLYRGVS